MTSIDYDNLPERKKVWFLANPLNSKNVHCVYCLIYYLHIKTLTSHYVCHRYNLCHNHRCDGCENIYSSTSELAADRAFFNHWLMWMKSFYNEIKGMRVKDVGTYLKPILSVGYAKSAVKRGLDNYHAKYIQTSSLDPIYHVCFGGMIFSYLLALPEERRHLEHES